MLVEFQIDRIFMERVTNVAIFKNAILKTCNVNQQSSGNPNICT